MCDLLPIAFVDPASIQQCVALVGLKFMVRHRIDEFVQLLVGIESEGSMTADDYREYVRVCSSALCEALGGILVLPQFVCISSLSDGCRSPF